MRALKATERTSKQTDTSRTPEPNSGGREYHEFSRPVYSHTQPKRVFRETNTSCVKLLCDPVYRRQRLRISHRKRFPTDLLYTRSSIPASSALSIVMLSGCTSGNSIRPTGAIHGSGLRVCVESGPQPTFSTSDTLGIACSSRFRQQVNAHK